MKDTNGELKSVRCPFKLAFGLLTARAVATNDHCPVEVVILLTRMGMVNEWAA